MENVELLPVLLISLETTEKNVAMCRTAIQALDKCMRNNEILSTELLDVRAERDALRKEIARMRGRPE